jgi:hypothetical protein
MSTTRLSTDTTSAELVTERWRLDPARSSVEFRVPHFWGLVTVKGHFKLYEGTLDLRSEPAVQLTIEADSLDTGIAKRDQHLRSADFFDAAHYPQVRFASDSAVLDGDSLKVRGRLHAAGKHPSRARRRSRHCGRRLSDRGGRARDAPRAGHDLEPAWNRPPDQQVNRQRTAPTRTEHGS